MLPAQPKKRYSYPDKAYTANVVFKDSQIWDYLQYNLLSRISRMVCELWEDPGATRLRMLNLISAVDQLEYMVLDKIEKKHMLDDFALRKPQIFNKMRKDPGLLKEFIEGTPYVQLKLKMLITKWLKELSQYQTTLKATKKSAFMAGEGEMANEPAPESE